MKIRNIALDDDETPETITVDMTLAEAVWIATAAGVQVPSSKPTDDIYEALAGGVFNRFFEEGVEGANR